MIPVRQDRGGTKAEMIDVFDIMGPIMVGPSSSHTAGAVRIGRMARTLLGERPVKAALHLHGSFAETGVGHGTDKALVAGLLGMAPDDFDIPNSFAVAEERGLKFTFDEIDLRDAHPNSVRMEVAGESGKCLALQACSTGGGRILVNMIDGVALSFAGDYNTLIIHNRDDRGHVADVTYALSQARVNVANMSLHRNERGGSAIMVIEMDEPVPLPILKLLEELPGILRDTYYEKED